jgi:hypothetical protein
MSWMIGRIRTERGFAVVYQRHHMRTLAVAIRRDAELNPPEAGATIFLKVLRDSLALI